MFACGMPSAVGRSAAGDTCPACGTELGAGVLACPGCQRLIHAAALADLKERADRAAAAGDRAAEAVAWTEALGLLPRTARQHAANRRAARRTGQAPTPEIPKTGPWRWLGGLGTFGALAWKFKFIALAALGKGRFL